jgi:hypothetical protein
VPEGIDARVEAMQAGSTEPAGNHGVAHPEVPELPPADDTVLALGKAHDGFCVRLCPTVGHIGTQNGHGVILGAETSRIR